MAQRALGLYRPTSAHFSRPEFPAVAECLSLGNLLKKETENPRLLVESSCDPMHGREKCKGVEHVQLVSKCARKWEEVPSLL
jgi:hypothetical protein